MIRCRRPTTYSIAMPPGLRLVLSLREEDAKGTIQNWSGDSPTGQKEVRLIPVKCGQKTEGERNQMQAHQLTQNGILALT
jgi:hypothetical protein